MPLDVTNWPWTSATSPGSDGTRVGALATLVASLFSGAREAAFAADDACWSSSVEGTLGGLAAPDGGDAEADAASGVVADDRGTVGSVADPPTPAEDEARLGNRVGRRERATVGDGDGLTWTDGGVDA